jgi:hypothetical protein
VVAEAARFVPNIDAVPPATTGLVKLAQFTTPPDVIEGCASAESMPKAKSTAPVKKSFPHRMVMINLS